MVTEVPHELVAAAMASATGPASAISIFAPFDAFKWAPNDTPSAKPVGSISREAKDVAWLFSCVPHLCTSECKQVAEWLTFATHLRREAPIAEALYANLCTKSTGLVHMSEIEQALGCTWAEVEVDLGGSVQRMDPYLWKLLEGIVRESIQNYITQLDQLVTKLMGCEMGQTWQDTETAMEGVRRATAHHLSTALLQRSTNVESLVRLLGELRNTWLAREVAQAKTRMRRSINRVRALSRVVAAPDQKLDEVLQEEESDLRDLFAEFPVELEDALKSQRVSILEIGPVFAPQRSGLVQSSSCVPPASFAVRASVLSRWLNRHGTQVAEACVAAIAMLRRTVDMPHWSTEWSGVQLAATAPTDPRTRGCSSESMVAWHAPSHLACSDVPRAIIVDSSTNPCAGLRVARMFAVLMDQARLGLLPPVTLRADLVVPIVARFASEGMVNYRQLVDMHLRPIAARCETRWPEDNTTLGKRRIVPSPVPPEEPCTAIVPAAPAVPVQAVPVQAVPVQHIGSVPAKLLRDHCILHGFALCLQAVRHTSSVRISLDGIVRSVRGISPALATQSDSSLRQAVRWVCCEAIKRAHAQAAEGGVALAMGFSSERCRAHNGHVGGVVCEGAAVSYLYRYVTWVVNQMRFDGERFCAVWRASRSSQSKAASIAHKITGDKCARV